MKRFAYLYKLHNFTTQQVSFKYIGIGTKILNMHGGKVY
jgi:hypothetical protein